LAACAFGACEALPDPLTAAGPPQPAIAITAASAIAPWILIKTADIYFRGGVNDVAHDPDRAPIRTVTSTFTL